MSQPLSATKKDVETEDDRTVTRSEIPKRRQKFQNGLRTPETTDERPIHSWKLQKRDESALCARAIAQNGERVHDTGVSGILCADEAAIHR